MKYPRIISRTFKVPLEEILKTNAYKKGGHCLYPADDEGNHLENFFLIENVVKNENLVDAVTDDMALWARNIDFDVIFAPAQHAVMKLANKLAGKLGKITAFWEYLPSGRFGNKLVEGDVKGKKCIVFNGVTQQGRCVGLRLPQFVESVGGTIVAACVFAKGTTSLVEQTEKKWGSLFYSTIQVDVKVYPPKECPLCGKEPLKKWTKLLKT